jgi:Rod binding domain-containing protein
MKVSLAGATPVEAPTAEQPQNAERLQQAARQFEAIMLKRMLSSLEKTTKLDSGKGTSMYGSMIVDAMADAIVGSGGLGLSKMIEQTLPGEVAKKGNDVG